MSDEQVTAPTIAELIAAIDRLRECLDRAAARDAESAPRITGDFVTVKQAGRLANTSERVVRAMVAGGRLTEYRVGGPRGHLRIKRDELAPALRVQRDGEVDIELLADKLFAKLEE